MFFAIVTNIALTVCAIFYTLHALFSTHFIFHTCGVVIANDGHTKKCQPTDDIKVQVNSTFGVSTNPSSLNFGVCNSSICPCLLCWFNGLLVFSRKSP